MSETLKAHVTGHAAPVLIPEFIEHPGSADHPWNEIPLGICYNHEEVVWDVNTAPHSLTAGPAGSGKTSVQRSIINHCIDHPDDWTVLGIDATKVTLEDYEDHRDVVLGVARDLDAAMETLRYVHDECERRFDVMGREDLSFEDLPDTQKSIMLVVDGLYTLLAPNPSYGTGDAALRTEALSILTDLSIRGHRAGVHLSLTTQHPNPNVITKELQENLTFRIAAGKLDPAASYLLLNDSTATVLPAHILGRGWVQYGDKGKPVQFYYVAPSNKR